MQQAFVLTKNSKTFTKEFFFDRYVKRASDKKVVKLYG